MKRLALFAALSALSLVAACDDDVKVMKDLERQAREAVEMRQGGEPKAAAANAAAAEAFLAKNATKAGVQTTPSGLQYEVVRSVSGAAPKPGPTDTVRVNYEGRLLDGTVFDSSYERGEPVSFPLNGVIPGWTEGLQLMKVGEEFLFTIPPELAYGPSGQPPTIPPNSALIFRVELLGVN